MQTSQIPGISQPEPPGYLTLPEAAKVLGVPYSTAHRWAARLGGSKMLGRWRLDPQRIDAMLAGGAR